MNNSVNAPEGHSSFEIVILHTPINNLISEVERETPKKLKNDI